ncbi:M60 family metallopeptidase [Candidatus Enterococcus mansonii]|uniref:S-layer protein n=1 Tax=Candidatus Enterococcus mansonii TaxID=1834181 RepID=A0A242C5Y0_9ENTE|nr:M60 family metallopeptidase [Enterococcus sp. 4G2_DIV0659]OTO05667.1 hypothetical protein A5880_002842 [Enterococcus sp. 4G2_DIV0659]
MKKKQFYTYLGTTMLLTILASSTIYAAEGHATQAEATNQSSVLTPEQKYASVQLTLTQSEDVPTYRKVQLDNYFGASNDQSTGVYKRSTDVITIYVDERTDQTELPTYTISPVVLNQSREGNPTKFPLKKGKNIINNTNEGIIHLQNISKVTSQKTLSVTVEGGTQLPRFILGKTTETDWQNQIRQNPNAPGYELVGKHTVITGSKETVKHVKTPKKTLETYDKVVENHNKTAGLDNSSSLNRTSRGIFQHMRETQDPKFYMYASLNHTGYSKNSGMANMLTANPTDMWGPMHELGHTYQMERMTWRNQTEVTVNIFSLRSEKAFGNKSRLERDGVYNRIFSHFQQPNKNYDSNTDLFVRLGMFWQLELAFGDNFYPQLHKLYREEAKSLTSDVAKQQYFITSASKIANKNLQPYFDMWGLPVTAETKQVLQQYPKLTHKIWEYRDEMKNPISPIDPAQPEKPAAPTNLSAVDVKHDSVKIKWNNAQSAKPIKEYIIYRDGKEIARTSATDWTDKSVKATTTYNYSVATMLSTGETSDRSMNLQIRTPNAPIVETPAPSKPVNVLSSNITQDSITLNWSPSTSPVGVSGYNVYRNGVKITTVRTTTFKDSGLQANTNYTYQIAAFDSSNKESAKSDSHTVKTKAAENQLSTWESNKVYTAGNKVFYNNLEYEAKWWTQGNRPDRSDAWKLLSDAVMEWDSKKAYVGGDTVTFQGKTYKAKWWTQNNQPGNTPVWELVK